MMTVIFHAAPVRYFYYSTFFIMKIPLVPNKELICCYFFCLHRQKDCAVTVGGYERSKFSQDPFRNKPTDTTVTAIARNIEINIKQLLHEKDIPQPVQPGSFYLM